METLNTSKCPAHFRVLVSDGTNYINAVVTKQIALEMNEEFKAY